MQSIERAQCCAPFLPVYVVLIVYFKLEVLEVFAEAESIDHELDLVRTVNRSEVVIGIGLEFL
jgi:hypothetical protein